ncbi:MAG: ABC transporter ATP-binding protein, partial [Minisyncoccia bacterium]
MPDGTYPTQEKNIAKPARVFSVYCRYTRTHPWLTTTIVVGMLLVQAGGLVAPLYLRQFFNVLAAGPTARSFSALMLTLALLGAIWLINWLGYRLQDTASAYLESRVRARLLSDSFEYLLGHSYDFFLSNFAGSLTSKVGKYARAYETLFSLAVTQMAPMVIYVGGAVIILFVRNAALGAILAVWSIAFIVFQLWLAKLRWPKREERSAADTRVTAALADAIGNQSTIAVFSGAKDEQQRFDSTVDRWRDLAWGLWRFDSWVWAALGLFTVAVEVALLGAAAFYWQRGELTVGDFILIESYLLTTITALMGINYQIRNFYDALADAGEMVYLLDLPHSVADVNGAVPLCVTEGRIVFDEVVFYFRETRPILQKFSLTIAPGEKAALVGPSGAGKSTLLKLLLRLYDVSGGKIEIDGMRLSHATQDSVRESVGFVPQEPILFHRTLMENIRYGRRDATDEEVIDAARRAHCDKFIDVLPEGYNT